MHSVVCSTPDHVRPGRRLSGPHRVNIRGNGPRHQIEPKSVLLRLLGSIPKSERERERENTTPARRPAGILRGRRLPPLFSKRLDLDGWDTLTSSSPPSSRHHVAPPWSSRRGGRRPPERAREPEVMPVLLVYVSQLHLVLL